MRIGDRFVAVVPIHYRGQNLERGEVFAIGDRKSNGVMRSSREAKPLGSRARPSRCAYCGREFEDALQRDAHGQRAHGEVKSHGI